MNTNTATVEAMTMSAFLATDGGRRCPQCGKFAKASELGSIGEFLYNSDGRRIGHYSAYGHLPGYGCNKEKEAAP